MMCLCDKEFAERYLPHQIEWGNELKTRRQVPVTLGFQPNICNTCRNLREEPRPMAEIHGRTSKIARYYWREISFDTIRKFAEWASTQGYSDWTKASIKHQDVFRSFEREVTAEIRKLHEKSPKYTYRAEESHAEVLSKYKVEVINLDGTYIKTNEGRALILDGDDECSPEEYAKRYFIHGGYKVLFTESVPFHVLFGTFMWMLIQHPSDPRNRIVGFGNRHSFDSGEPEQQIWTMLPEDFGSPGYGERRAKAIEEHLDIISGQKDNLLWLFDYWTPHSEDLRQYLWAHRSEDVQKARAMISILPSEVVIRILRYLVTDYWRRFVGWPDLLVHNESEFFFAEVKSSSDKLSEDQKNWIRGNDAELKLTFKVVKIHKKAVIDRTLL